MDWLARILFRGRFAIWIGVACGAALLWFVNRPVQFDQSIEGFFPPDHPALLSYRKAREAFGGDDFVFVAYEDRELWTPDGMARVHELTRAIRQDVSGVMRVDSLDQMPLPWKVDAAVEKLLALPAGRRALALPGIVAALATVESEVRAYRQRPDALAELKRRVSNDPLFRNLFVDRAGKSTSLIVQLKPPDVIDQKKSIIELRQVADRFANGHGFDRAAVVGPPVLLADGFISLERDNQRLGSVAMVLMALAMLVAVRSPWWAVLPLASGAATWLITEAFLNAMELHLTLSAGPIIAQTVVLCMPAASHLAMHYREARRRSVDGPEAARHTLVAVALPVAWCSLTAAAGYLALLSSTVKPVFQFGLTMAVCNLVAGILAYALAPGAMQPPQLFRRRMPIDETDRGQFATPSGDLDHLGRLTAWVLDHPRSILAGLIVPSLLIAVGIGRLQFESNYVRIYRSDSRVARDYRFVEDRMGGIGLVELVLPGPQDGNEITPNWLSGLRELADNIRASHPQLVTEVLTLGDVLASEKPLSDDTAAAGAEPPAERKRTGILGGLLGRANSPSATPEQVIQTKLSVLSTPGFSHFIENFWDRPTGQTRLVIRIRESADTEMKQRAFDQMVSSARASYGSECMLTGLSHLMTQVTRAIITTQFQSTGLSCGVILIMLALALRSLRLGVLALLPTLLAVSLVLGTMGWLGIRIDLSTALVASVAMGLSVDDTFHCLLRWKREIRSGRAADEALRVSYAGTGPGVVLSSVAVSVGFLALVVSEFVPTANFGWLVAVATLGGSIGNLVVLPACLALGVGFTDFNFRPLNQPSPPGSRGERAG